MTIVLEPVRDPDAWMRDFSDPLPLQQSWGYGAVLAGSGLRPERLIVRDDAGPVAAAQLLHRRFFGLIDAQLGLRGPLWLSADHSRRAAAVKALVRRRSFLRRRLVLVSPDEAEAVSLLQAAGFKRLVSVTACVWLDLSSPMDDLRAQLHGKWRNALVKAEKSGLAIRPLSRKPERYLWLLEAEAKQRKARRYLAAPASLVTDYQRLAPEPEPLMGLAAYDGKKVIAGQMFLIHGMSATYHLGWTGIRDVPAHHLLLWQAIGRLKAMGVRWLDLGTLDTGPGAGLARFKLGLGVPATVSGGIWG